MMQRSPSWISRLETGQIGIRSKELRELLDYYEVADRSLREHLEELAEQGRQRAWWSSFRDSLPEQYYRYIGYEHEASGIEWAGSAVIPGLLQTPDLARAIHDRHIPKLADSLIQERVTVRMRRKQLVFGERAMPLKVVLAEAALRREIGGRDVLCGQLDALLDAMDLPNVEVQVVPDTYDVAALLPPSLTIFSMGPDEPKVVHREDTFVDSFETGEMARQGLEIFQIVSAVALSQESSRAFVQDLRTQLCG